jgi:hypothetical protein
MAGMHKFALMSVRGVVLLEDGNAVFVPLLDGSETFGGFVVLLKKVLLVLLALVELLLLLELD